MARFELLGSERFEPVGEVLRSQASARVPGAQRMEVTLVLRHGAELPSVEELCAAPPRVHLTHEQFEAKYGVAQRDLATVERFAREHGLDIVQVRRGHALVTLAGSPKAIKSAFKVDLKHYRRDKLNFIGHTHPVSLPTALRKVVKWVIGLDTQPLVRSSAHALPIRRAKGAEDGLLSYPAADVAKLYEYPRHHEGAGQCVGIVELTGGYTDSDMDAYYARFGLDRSLLVNVGPNKAGWHPPSDAEVTMDVQLVAAACPKARVAVYNAGSRNFSLKDYHDVFATAIGDRVHRPSVLSSSWSFYEGSLIKKEEEAAFELLFRKAAMLGITICGASGDLGSQVPVQGASPTEAITTPATSYPAASALVLGCGGTTLVARDGRIEEERVWNRLNELMIMTATDTKKGSKLRTPPDPVSAGASSGGVSAMNDLPAYQRDMSVPPLVTMMWHNGAFKTLERRTGRGVPDVAADGDLNTGYEIYFRGGWGVAAGTSAAAPMWAALLTRINEGLGQRVGFLQPLLYPMVRAGLPVVRRITEGGNGAFFASPRAEWNACTGLGSPAGEALLEALKKAVSARN